MYCTRCGFENPDSAQFCTKCGFSLTPKTDEPHEMSSSEDESSIGYNILSCLIPIVGFILYLVWKDKTPKKAQSCLLWAATGFCVGLIMCFL